MVEVKVLFVCMGNICRSPTGQGVFESIVSEAGMMERIKIDSAGTHAYHVGEPPDTRASEAAKRRGIDLGKQRARRVTSADFAFFDYIVAMDNSNLDDLMSICPEQHQEKISRLLDFAADTNKREVPDPYYGGEHGFERVLDLVEQGAYGLLEDICKRL